MPTKIREWGYLDRLLDTCGLIMQKPRTSFELQDVTEYQPRTIHGYVAVLGRCGLIRVIGHTKVGKGHSMRPIFAWAGASSDSEPRHSRGSIVRLLKVLKLIGREPRSIADIERATGYRVVAIRGYVKRLHRNGLIYVAHWGGLGAGPADRKRAFYALQSSPYAQEDRRPG